MSNKITMISGVEDEGSGGDVGEAPGADDCGTVPGRSGGGRASQE